MDNSKVFFGILAALLVGLAVACPAADFRPFAASDPARTPASARLDKGFARTPIYRPDLTLDDPPSFSLTPDWLEDRGIKVQLIGDQVSLKLPFITRPRKWLAQTVTRLARAL